MGRTGTYNYQIQVEEGSRVTIQGANKYNEALQLFFIEAVRLNSKRGYIWPQTKTARRKLGADYIQIDLNEYDRAVSTKKYFDI
jgi:hypothetical protein